MKKIILASASPRRKELLTQMGLQFIVIPSTVEEKIQYEQNPTEAVKNLASQKAVDVFDASVKKQNDTIVIGADTIVVSQDRILGKPSDQNEAYNMLKSLSGKWHEVITGICIIGDNGQKIVREVEKTRVKIRTLSESTIQNYIKTGEPDDKAGGYGIQGLGAMLVEKIEGCYFNVVGLPVTKLAINLEQFGIKIL